MKMTEDFSTNYFQKCDERVDLSYANYYFMFLQSWIMFNVKDYYLYDKTVFWFQDNELDKVELVKVGSIVKSFNRTAWMQPSMDLDSRFEEESYADEFTNNEEVFCEKIIHHWASTPTSENTFLVTVSKDSYNFK
jgi:hypothetical protein